MEQEPLTEKVIGCAIEVHRIPGPGLLESAREQCLARELALQGIGFQLQVPVPVEYKGVHLECGYRIDVLVDGGLILELKAVETILGIHNRIGLSVAAVMRKCQGNEAEPARASVPLARSVFNGKSSPTAQ